MDITSKKAAGSVCSAKNCKNKQYTSKESFFRFPKDVRRARIWAIACHREDLLNQVDSLYESHRLCGAHFTSDMFCQTNVRNRLQPHATPTIFPSLEGSSGNYDHTYSALTSMCKSPLVSDICIGKRKYSLLEEPSETLQQVTRNIDVSEEVPEKVRILEDVGIVPGETRSALSSLDLNIPTTESEESQDKYLLSPSSSTQTSLMLSSHSPRKEKFRRTIKSLQRENDQLKKKNKELLALDHVTLEQYKLLTLKFCPSMEVANFINVQVSQIQHHPKGRRYTLEFKKACLAMYFTGPKLYKKKLMQTFCLPTPKTLLKVIKCIKTHPGLDNEELFHMLKMKAENFRQEDKQCVLCIDEMSIKANLFYNRSTDSIVGLEDYGKGKRVFKPALNATVLMIRGIYSTWKQPLSYHFFNSNCPGTTLKNIITEAILKLKSIGLNVSVVISDMGSNNLVMAKSLNVTPETPFFYVEGQKIIYMFDTPHLIKAVRNNLMKYKFVYNGKAISWEYIKIFYNHDKKYSTRAAPKLTDSHVYPNNFQKMKVKFATQVFSATVSAALNVYVRFGILPSEAVATSEFIERMDKLFDILNSSNTTHAKKFNRAFKGLPYQLEFLQDCYKFFDELKVYNNFGEEVTNKIKFIKCFKITISGLIHLWDSLKNINCEYLLTRRLNQDSLENFFGTVRQQNGNCINPTPIQFERSFKKLLCINLFHSGTENCEGDSDKMLLKITDMSKSKEHSIEEPIVSNPKTSDIDTDYQSNDILEKNFRRYVCGYLIKKSLSIHACSICQNYAKAHDELDDTSLFCFFKAYENETLDTFGNLNMPDDNFVNFIAKLEYLFGQHFEVFAINRVSDFYNICKMVSFDHPCNNFPKDFVVRLYIRLKIFYTLKFVNQNFKTTNYKNKIIIWKHE